MASSLIIAYLFLGGAGAGMILVLSIMSFLSPVRDIAVEGSGRMRPLGVYTRLYGLGYCVSGVICVISALCLVFDMARPDAILGLILNPNPSVVSIGAYSLGLCILFSAILAVIWLSQRGPSIVLCRIVAVGAIISALIVMAYTGLLLGIIPHIVFWQSPLIVALFILSSLSCGIALVVLAMTVFRLIMPFWHVSRGLLIIDGVLVVLELIALMIFVISSSRTAPLSVEVLLAGELSILFWAGLVIAGLIIPLVLEVMLHVNDAATALHPCVPSLFVLVGGCCLRICIVLAA